MCIDGGGCEHSGAGKNKPWGSSLDFPQSFHSGHSAAPATNKGSERVSKEFKVTQFPERWILPDTAVNSRWAVLNLDLLRHPGWKDLPGKHPSRTDMRALPAGTDLRQGPGLRPTCLLPSSRWEFS